MSSLSATETSVSGISKLRPGHADDVTGQTHHSGLAVSDLECLLTLQWLNICFNPLFQQADLSFGPFQIEYITGGWPHVCFVRITGLITAYITLERCLCITMPLKVKLIMTPRNTVVFVISAHLVMFACTAQAYSVNLPHWEWNPRRNRNILGLRLTSNREEVKKYAHGLNNSFGFGTFVVIIVLTIILTSSVNSKTSWRDQHAPVLQGAIPTAKLASASGTVSSASKKDG
ncbi:Zinc finger protein 692 [Plakobranchus ocellatus]|uniref:Zinc finger protein 692 n=1 Tax=Plakobranchus ocellatus TaxID=259542 RepID=A0AAV4AAK0_9GAST|nr:Zinc finger protein 692 [Plakobranchus ocellatus]